MPSITAIVVNWNAPQLTSRAVHSLLASAGVASFEVIVVDNGSSDGSAETLEREFAGVAGVRILPLPTNRGFGGGVNAGMRASRAERIALLNNDAVADAGWLAALSRELDSPGAERVGAVTSTILLEGLWRELPTGEEAKAGSRTLTSPDGMRFTQSDASDPRAVRLINSTGNELDESGNGGDRDWLRPVSGQIEASPEVFGFCGGAAMLRRDAIRDVGGFDESLFMYYEDTDLSWRIRQAGWEVRYCADALVTHAHGASSDAASAARIRWNARNRVIVAMQNAPAAMAARALARTLARTAAVVLRRPTSRSTRAEANGMLLALGDIAVRTPNALGRRLHRLRRARYTHDTAMPEGGIGAPTGRNVNGSAH